MRRRAVVDWSKSHQSRRVPPKIIPLALPRRCQLRNRSREGAAGAEGTVISAGANAGPRVEVRARARRAPSGGERRTRRSAVASLASGGEGKVSEERKRTRRRVPNRERVPRNDVRGVARWSPGTARSTAREDATMTS